MRGGYIPQKQRYRGLLTVRYVKHDTTIFPQVAASLHVGMTGWVLGSRKEDDGQVFCLVKFEGRSGPCAVNQNALEVTGRQA